MTSVIGPKESGKTFGLSNTIMKELIKRRPMIPHIFAPETNDKICRFRCKIYDKFDLKQLEKLIDGKKKIIIIDEFYDEIQNLNEDDRKILIKLINKSQELEFKLIISFRNRCEIHEDLYDSFSLIYNKRKGDKNNSF